MRQGASTRPWTSRDVRYLLDNAGNVPVRDICRELRRSSSSVTSMADKLRRQGYAISLRHYEPRTAVCPSCGRLSVTARETGICRPCQLTRQLTAINGEISDLMARMPAEVRATYEETEAEIGSRAVDPMPLPPRRHEGSTRYQIAKDEDEYQIALEQWEARRVHRQVKSAQKRKERMRRKLWKFLHR